VLSHLLKQEGLLSQRQCDASCPSAVSFNSTIRYPEHSLLLLVTLASDLPMHTTKFCSVVFGVMSRLSVINNITDARRFVIHLLWSTSAATYCYKWWVSSTCHSPVALCLQQLMVTSLTTCNYAIWWSKTVIFSYPTCTWHPFRGYQSECCNNFWYGKTWMVHLPMMNTARQMDGQTDTARRHRLLLCIASCRKTKDSFLVTQKKCSRIHHSILHSFHVIICS